LRQGPRQHFVVSSMETKTYLLKFLGVVDDKDIGTDGC
jgi:hypothetical protein